MKSLQGRSRSSSSGQLRAARLRIIWDVRIACILAFLAVQCGFGADRFPVETITPSVSVVRGPVNGVLINAGGKTLAIYGDPRDGDSRAERVLFTHYRRDVTWAGRRLLDGGAEPVYPAAEEPLFTGVQQFWAKYSQFHDYANQSSKILTSPIRAGHPVRGGDRVEWIGPAIEVRDTPGYTRGAVSYLFTADGKRIACVGDLIYGDGQILDLFSLQDAIPATGEDGYHGYASRAAQVITSLRQIADWKPDIIIPARGPVIANPQQAIAKLITRLQDVFASYFAISALRFYRGDDKLAVQARRILGDRPVNWMRSAQTAEPPSWIRVIGNTRVIVSASGAAFVVDCGSRRILDGIKQLQHDGVFKTVEGIWVTHYHDDHTNFVQTASEELNAPVMATPELGRILMQPADFRMPCLTSNPIRHVQVKADGSSERWHEFQFTYSYFPGQTLYHDGLMVKKDGGESVFFIGDSFTPTGIDDYCVLNRNFVEPEKGFEYCLNYVKRARPDWLVNQHVNPAFHFNDAQLDTMIDNVRVRRTQLAALFPWDDPDFGIDEQWARFEPYRREVPSGGRIALRIVILNHSSDTRDFLVTPHEPPGWTMGHVTFRVRVPSRESREVIIPATAGAPGLGVVTADIAFDKWDLRQWIEAPIDVK